MTSRSLGLYLASDLFKSLPTVMRETMDVLAATGERYLWVDSLGICQGDDEQTRIEVHHIDEI